MAPNPTTLFHVDVILCPTCGTYWECRCGKTPCLFAGDLCDDCQLAALDAAADAATEAAATPPKECCAGTCKTHEATAENGSRWLLCTRHAAEVKDLGYLTVKRLRAT